MADSHLESLLQVAERRAVLTVLRRHPEWTLGHVLTEIQQNGARGQTLRELTLGELFDDLNHLSPIAAPADGGPPIDRRRLREAERLRGPDFDECVRAVIDEAGNTLVSASYFCARVGGPRWKLQASLRRLVAAGKVERRGSTSATRYRSRAGS